jgi:hypothetical protein
VARGRHRDRQNRIVFPHEKAPGVASGSYLTMKIDGPWGVGRRPEVQNRTDLGQQPGQEVQQTVIEHNELTVSVQAYTLQEDKGRHRQGTARLRADLALSKPSQKDAFNTAGFSFVYAERVNSLPRLPPEGEGRANMDVHFYVFDSVVDAGPGTSRPASPSARTRSRTTPSIRSS